MTVSLNKNYLFFALLALSLCASIQTIVVNATSPIEVTDCYWTLGDDKVTTAEVGDEIVAHVIIKASTSFQGTIKINLIQDVETWTDEDYLEVEKSLILSQGSEKEVTIPFIPYESTGDLTADVFGSFTINGYYIEVKYGDDTIYKMDNYPPRLTITQPYWALCIEDSTIENLDKGTNNGGESYLEIMDTSGEYFGGISKTYIKFDLSALPENAIIDKAILKAHTSLIVTTANIGAYYCTDSSWSEYSITWNNAPSCQSSSMDITNVNNADTWFSWDLSSKFTELSSFNEVTIVLVNEEHQSYGSYIWFHSKDQEYDWMKGYRPKLAIYWHEPKPSSSISLTTQNTEVFSSNTIEARLTPNLSNQQLTFNLETPSGLLTRTAQTDSSGKATINIVHDKIGSYSVSVTWSGNDQYEGSSTEKTFTVTQTDLQVTTNTISSNIIDETSTFSGTVNPKQTLSLILVIINPESSETRVNIESNTNGFYTYDFIPTLSGEWHYYIIWEGNDEISAYQTQQISFTIVEPPPVGSVEVSVQDSNKNPINQVQISLVNKPQGQTSIAQTTNSQGIVSFSNIIVGTYSIKLEKSGYNTETAEFSIVEDQTENIQVTMTQIVSSLKLIVKDDKAKTISDATITSISQPSGQSTLEATTGSDGIVLFVNILPGSYEILAVHEEYESQRLTITCTGNTQTEKTILLETIEEQTTSGETNTSPGGISSFPMVSILISICIVSFFLKKTYFIK